MLSRLSKCALTILAVCATFGCQDITYAQAPSAPGSSPLASAVALNAMDDTATLDVYLKGPDGKPVAAAAVVTLIKLSKEPYRQETAKAGHIRFSNVTPTAYSLQVVAPGYKTTMRQVEADRDAVRMVTIELEQLSVEELSETSAYKALSPKAQKEIGKALDALSAKKLAEARNHLDAADRIAPNQAEVQYLFGVYSKQVGNEAQAKAYWGKAVEYSPKHLLALLSLADASLRENQADQALSYATRAVEAEPSSWRGHMILANVYLRQGLADDAVTQAERAIELGREQAVTVQPILAAALARRGQKQKAVDVLDSYLKQHATDKEARNLEEELTKVSAADAPAVEGALTSETLPISSSAATALPLPSSWLPPDVDESVPPVEAGAVCALDDVLRNAGKRVEEFVRNVDRFTATEDLVHRSVDKFGVSSAPQIRKFDYVVSIAEHIPGFLNVDEYRNSHGTSSEFPDGIATNGLPALALIFHPYNAKNFEMACEGLGRWGGGLAWQVHFRQRPDRPNTMRAYRLGVNSPSYPVALRGRAWIAADSYQILRLETDLVAGVPEIRLVADHTAIEYGPVRFQNSKVDMWLPQSAEVYFDWKGRRMHRRHSFSNYLLFSVDEKQHISAPKEPADKSTTPSNDNR